MKQPGDWWDKVNLDPEVIAERTSEMSKPRIIRVSLTSNDAGDSCVRVVEVTGDWGVQEQRQLWFGTYEELAQLVEKVAHD
jgi:hypothetical protein